MSYEQARVLITVIHKMLLRFRNNEPISTSDIDEWAKQISWIKDK